MATRVTGFLLIALAFVQAALAAPQSPSELRSTVLLLGNVAGSEVVRTSADGRIEVIYEFNDRGRGPRHECTLALTEGSILESLTLSGHDYFKGSVSETFSLTTDRATWRNQAESGSRALKAKAFYLPFNTTPYFTGLLARAALATPERRLALLPDGEVSISKVEDVVLEGAGSKQTVTLFTLTGLDLRPVPLWLDAAGQLFALDSGWQATVRSGWEGSLERLRERQKRAENVLDGELARRLARRPETAVVFRNARLFDAKTATVKTAMAVVVAGNRIAAIGPEGEAGNVKIPAGALQIDASGMTLIPGLWDMHVHVDAGSGALHLAAGVTSVRDLANDLDEVAELARRWNADEALGPRIVNGGMIDGRGPFAGPTKLFVDTPEEARAAIDELARRGYLQVKIYSSIKPELVPVIADYAHAKGLRVSGHIPAFMTAEQAVRQGYDEIQHINMLFLNFWPNEVPDTRTPARFTEVAARAAGLDLAGEPVQSFLELLKARGTVIDPTLSIFEDMFTARPGNPSPSLAPVVARLPPLFLRGALAGGLPVPEEPGMDQRYRDSFRALVRMVGELYKNGIPIVAGTDSVPGFALHRELELYVEAGIPPAEVLKLATLGAAKIARRDQDLGSLEIGKLADLVLVLGDPTKDLSALRNPQLVLKNGMMVRPEEIYEALGLGRKGATGAKASPTE